MSVHQEIALDATVYFWFNTNDTSGSAGDATSPLFDVRLGGDTAGAIPILSGTPTLLTHANYQPGAYEVAIAATTGNGFDWFNTYAVYATATIDSQTPGAFIGSFAITPRAAGIDSMVIGTVDNTAFTATTTILESDDITEATSDHFKGKSLVFYRSTDAAVYRIATKIEGYTLTGGRGRFTYTAIADVPPDNAKFIVI